MTQLIEISYTLQTIICKYLKQLTSWLKNAFQSLLRSHLYLRPSTLTRLDTA